MELDSSITWESRSKTIGTTAAGQLTCPGESFLATRRLRRRRQKLQAPFKAYSGSFLITSYVGVHGGEDNSTNNIGCSNTSVDTIIEHGNVNVGENNSGKNIMAVISSCLELVSTLSNDLHVIGKHVFGSCRFQCNAGCGAGPSSHGGGTHTQVDVANVCVSEHGYEARLQALLTYLSKTECNFVEKEFTDFTNVSTNPMQGLVDRNRHVSGQISESLNCSSVTKPETVTNFEKTVVSRNKIPSLPQRSSAAKSQEQAMTSNNAVAEQRISELKGSCRVMLQCMKSIVQILFLALEANRVAQQAVKWVATREFEVLESIVAIASDTASVTSQCVRNGLAEVENAMVIHKELVKVLEELVTSSCHHQVTVHVDDGAKNVGKLVRHTSDICLHQMAQDPAIASTNTVQPCAQNESLNGEAIDSSDEIPSQASQSLLRATESSLCAVDAALTVLEILSVSEVQLK